MKKYLLLTLVVFVALSITEAIADPAFLVEYDEAHGVSQVYISGLSGSTDYSVILLRSGERLEADNILFLDQVRSATYGTLHLAFVQTGLEGSVLAVGGPVSGKISPCLLGVVSGSNGKTMTMPAALTEVEEEAFMGSGIQYVYLGSQVTRIGSRAFANCTSLEAIHIPDSVTDIADDAFSGSAHVKFVCSQNSPACTYALENNIPCILQ